jgi:hypothetical protein
MSSEIQIQKRKICLRRKHDPLTAGQFSSIICSLCASLFTITKPHTWVANWHKNLHFMGSNILDKRLLGKINRQVGLHTRCTHGTTCSSCCAPHPHRDFPPAKQQTKIPLPPPPPPATLPSSSV